jgi:hypothetical protein
MSGSLFALPKSFDPETLRTTPGKMLANMIRAYGIYIDDDSNSPSWAINIESGWGLKPDLPNDGMKGTDYQMYMPPQGAQEMIRNFQAEFTEKFFTQIFTGDRGNNYCQSYTNRWQVAVRAWCLDLLDIIDGFHVVTDWNAKDYWDLITNPDNYNTVGIGGGKPLSPWASKLPDDPLLKPCLDQGVRKCTSLGYQPTDEKPSQWQTCLFENQVDCYLQ